MTQLINKDMQQLYPSLITRLKTQHDAIENILSTIEASRLIIRPQPNKWNIHDNIAHLLRYQQIFVDRINLILQQENPFINRYVAEEDEAFESIRIRNLNDLIEQLHTERKFIYQLITQLSPFELKEIGTHKKFGSLNIIQWTEFFLLHEAHHIYTIFQLANDLELIHE